MRGPGRALRPRVRRPARHPLLRRRPGLAHLLRPRPDRPATAARRLPGAVPADRRRQRRDAPAHRDARPDRRRRPGPRHRRPRPGHRRDLAPTSPTPWCWPPAATATSSTCRPTPRAATPPRSGGRTGAARYFANPCFTQIHPTCIPRSGDHQSKLTLMSESLRNDGRIWVPEGARRHRGPPTRSPRTSATTTWSASTRPSATWCRATSPPAPRRTSATRAAASAPAARASTSTSPTPSRRLGRAAVEEKYGNLFEMYERITGENPYEVPMRIYPAVHYTMGGLWVDYDLQTTVPGLFAIGEANFSDHGANRLGASRADAGPGRRLLRAAGHHRRLPGPRARHDAVDADAPRGRRGRRPRPRTGIDAAARRSTATAPSTPSTASSATLHVGVLRHGPHRGRACARRWTASRSCARSSGAASRCPAPASELNQSLEKANRVADFLELAELMCLDALHRERVLRRPLPRGVARPPTARPPRDDERLRATSRPGSSPAPAQPPVLHKEDLDFEYVHPTQRSYA